MADKKSTAPYNFVSLPEKILPSEISSVDNFKKHIKTCAKISGEIQLEIETRTPIFLGGNAEKSFAPAGKYIIAGSSLRGAFKNIFKIITCGAFRGGDDFNDEHIYFRCIMGTPYAWMKDLNKFYKLRMEDRTTNRKNARPGFLIQTADNKYFIAPLRPNLQCKNDFIMIKDFTEKFGVIKNSRVYWDGDTAYILTGLNKPEKLLTRTEYENFKKSLKGLTEDARKKRIAETKHGKQIIRYVKLGYVDWSKRIDLPAEVITSYEHDRNRRGVNLFKNSGKLTRQQLIEKGENPPADVKSLIPCHYLEEGGKVTAFGHGQCFRIPYKFAISHAVPKKLQAEKIIDFADAIFGRKENWASRVAFEDAATISEIETLETAPARPLMPPNPTSYQLYLVQDDKILKHWEMENIRLRGYKMYWHNGKWDWKDDSTSRADLTKKLTPLKVGSKFQSKIRFQNLSEVELGALLMIFDLNGAQNPAYKIGMAKSLGFGSFKVKPKLFVETDAAYTEIFDADGFKNPYAETSAAKFLDAFKKHVESHGMLETWEKILRELNLMLDFDKKPAPNKIEAMRGNVQRGDVDERFKQRVPLPNIFEVLK